MSAYNIYNESTLSSPLNKNTSALTDYFSANAENSLNDKVDHDDSGHSSDSDEFNNDNGSSHQQIITKWNASIAIVPSEPDSQYVDDNYNRLTLVQVDDLFSFIRISNCKLLASEIDRRSISVKHCQDRNGLTILHVVTELGDFDSVKYVCTIGANCNAVDRWGRTPLHLACHNGHVEVALYLIATYGCDPLARSNQGYTCLHYAALHAAMIQILLEIDKTSLRTVAINGCTPFLLSCKGGALDSVRLFFEEDQVDVLAADNNGVNGLCYASWNGFLPVVEFLLTNNSIKQHINHQSNYGYTCLHYACLNGNINIIEFLLENGADLEIRDENGMLAIDMNDDANLKQYLENSRILLGAETGTISGIELRTVVDDDDEEEEDSFVPLSHNNNNTYGNNYYNEDGESNEEMEEEKEDTRCAVNENEKTYQEREQDLRLPDSTYHNPMSECVDSTSENHASELLSPLLDGEEAVTDYEIEPIESILNIVREPHDVVDIAIINEPYTTEAEAEASRLEVSGNELYHRDGDGDGDDIEEVKDNLRKKVDPGRLGHEVDDDEGEEDATLTTTTAAGITATSSSIFSFTALPTRKSNNKFDLEADDEEVTANPFSLLGTASASSFSSGRVLTPPPVRRVLPVRRTPGARTRVTTAGTDSAKLNPVFVPSTKLLDPIFNSSVSIESSSDRSLDSEMAELSNHENGFATTVPATAAAATSATEDSESGTKYIATEDIFGTFDTRGSAADNQLPDAGLPSSDDLLRRSVFDFAAVGDVAGLQHVLGRSPLTTGIDINSVREAGTGLTPLHTACRLGNIHAVQFLVEGAGADVNVVDSHGNTPLHVACAEGHSLIVRYLVKFCGADLTLKDSQGRLAITLVNQPAGISEKEDIVRIITKGFRKSATKRTKIKVPRMSK